MYMEQYRQNQNQQQIIKMPSINRFMIAQHHQQQDHQQHHQQQPHLYYRYQNTSYYNQLENFADKKQQYRKEELFKNSQQHLLQQQEHLQPQLQPQLNNQYYLSSYDIRQQQQQQRPIIITKTINRPTSNIYEYRQTQQQHQPQTQQHQITNYTKNIIKNNLNNQTNYNNNNYIANNYAYNNNYTNNNNNNIKINNSSYKNSYFPYIEKFDNFTQKSKKRNIFKMHQREDDDILNEHRHLMQNGNERSNNNNNMNCIKNMHDDDLCLTTPIITTTRSTIVTSGTTGAASESRNTNNDLIENGISANTSTTFNGGIFNRTHHFTQIIAALAVSFGPLAAGLGKGYASPAIASLQELQIRHRGGNYTTFSVTDQEGSWLASLSLLGALFGGMFGGLAMQYGRKRVLAIMSIPFSLSWIITVFAKSVQTMFVTAVLGGFCCSIVSMVTQVYISEISAPDIRGFLSAIQKISGHLGILISFTLGAYLDWRQLAMLVSVAPMMLFVTVIYIPETPSYLVLRGREDEAYRSLQWLRGPHKNIDLELETIRSNIQTTKSLRNRNNNINLNRNLSATATTEAPVVTASGSTATNTTTTTNNATSSCRYVGRSVLPILHTTNVYLSNLSLRTIYTNIKQAIKNVRLVKPVLITCGLMVFQRFTGANSFGFYAVKIFRQTFAGMNPHGGAIAVAIVQLLASLLSGLLIDIIGRIPLLIISSVFMSLALASFGSYVYYEEINKTIITTATTNFYDNDMAQQLINNDWIPLLCVLVFTVAFSLGISPISSLLVGELFPLEYRGIGSSIATSFSYFCAFLGVKTFVDFQELLGLHGAFWLYACISCIGLFFVVMCVPETKGKDLDEMDPKYVRTLTINR